MRSSSPARSAGALIALVTSQEFPELETGGIGPMAGPAYQFDKKATKGRNPVAWPERYDDTPLFYEWTRDYIKGFHVDGETVGAIESVVDALVVDNPIDMEFGPDGALYVLEYGDGYFAENPEAQLARIDYVRGNRTPLPKITLSLIRLPVLGLVIVAACGKVKVPPDPLVTSIPASPPFSVTVPSKS